MVETVQPYYGNLTTNGGTGDLTLGAPLPGRGDLRTFAASVAKQIHYEIRNGNDTEWGTGTISTSGILARDVVAGTVVSGVHTSLYTGTPAAITVSAGAFVIWRNVEADELIDYSEQLAIITGAAANMDFLAAAANIDTYETAAGDAVANIDAFETQAGVIVSNLDGLESQADIIVSNLDSLEADAGDIVSNMDSLEAQAGVIVSNMDSLEGQADDIITTMTGLEGSAAADVATISGYETMAGDLLTDITAIAASANAAISGAVGAISGNEDGATVANSRCNLADDDDPDWPKRCRWTSWYNEALGTATRGTRRDFTSVFDAELTASALTVRDATQPSRPMSFIFNRGSQNHLWTSFSLTALAVANGKVAVGSAGSGVFLIDFLKDKTEVFQTVGVRTSSKPIIDRNSGGNELVNLVASGGIANNVVNHVAITCLPEAEIDPETGMRYVTIAVATDGGVSVINPTGTAAGVNVVTNSATVSAKGMVGFDGGALWATQKSTKEVQYYADYSSTSFPTTHNYTETTSPAVTGNAVGKKLAVGAGRVIVTAPQGMEVLWPNLDAIGNGMVARVTDSFATGVTKGDAVLATLADSTSGNVTDANMVANGSFAADISGWSGFSGTVADNTVMSHDGVNERLVLTNNGSGNARAGAAIATVPGRIYHVSLDVFTAVSAYLIQSVNANLSAGANVVSRSTDGVLEFTFTATTTTTYIGPAIADATGGYTASFDNVKVTELVADRSVKANHMTVVDTVGRSLIGAGGIAAYSFAAGYLTRPFNPGFATGNWEITGWLKLNGVDTDIETLIDISYWDGAAYDGYAIMLRIDVGNDDKIRAAISKDGFATSDVVAASVATEAWTIWHQFELWRDGGDLKLAINAGAPQVVALTYPADSVSNANASLTVGRRGDAVSQPLDNGLLSLLRIGLASLTDEERRRRHAFERRWFIDGNTPLLPGTPTGHPVYDFASDTALVATTGGAAFVSMTTGLVFKVIDSSNSDLASDAVTSVSLAPDGGYIIACATNRVYYEPAFNIREGR